MNKARHVSVDFCSKEKAIKLVNDPRFMALEEFSDSFYEVLFQYVY